MKNLKSKNIWNYFYNFLCDTLIIGNNKATMMTMLVICQDPVIRQFPEVSATFPIFTVEEMTVQTLEMSGCMIQGLVYLRNLL